MIRSGPVVAENTRGNFLSSVNGLRWVAALGVFLFHLSLRRTLPLGNLVGDTFAFAVQNAGWIAVTFFFVLSGFVHGWSGQIEPYPQFVRRRIVRLYPLHLTTMIVALVALGFSAVNPWVIPAQLTLTQAWVPRIDVFFSLNNPSWALCIEMLFYLTFFPAVRWLGGLSDLRLGIVLSLLITVALAIPLAVQLVPPGEVFGEGNRGMPSYGESILHFWIIYISPPVRLIEFAIGCSIAILLRRGYRLAIRPVSAAVIALICYLLSLFASFDFQLTTFYIVPMTIVIWVFAARDTDGFPIAPRLLSSDFSQSLSRLSLSFYLVHFPVLTLLTRFDIHSDKSILLWLAINFGALISSFLLSVLLHRHVESGVVPRYLQRLLRVSGKSDAPRAD